MIKKGVLRLTADKRFRYVSPKLPSCLRVGTYMQAATSFVHRTVCETLFAFSRVLMPAKRRSYNNY